MLTAPGAPGLARQDILARREWERYDSGEETRDMLEVRRAFSGSYSPGNTLNARVCVQNGVRRAHMEVSGGAFSLSC